MSAARFTGASKAIRNSTILIGTQFASILIRLVYLYVLVRYLTPARYGLLTYGMYWYLVVLPFTYMGADVVLGREIGRNRAAAPGLLGATLSLRSLAVTVGTLVSMAIAAFVENDPYIRSVIMIFSFSLIGRSLWMWSAAVFTAFEEVRPIAAIEITCRTLEIIVLIVLLETATPGIRAIAAVHAGSWLIQGLVAVRLVARRCAVSGWSRFGKWLGLLQEGLPGAAFAVSISLFFQLPLVLFRQIQGTGNTLGYFALAFQVITYLAAIPYLAAGASLPVLSRSAARRDAKDRFAAIIMVAVIIFGGVLLVVAASFFVEPMVRLVFGQRYGSAAIILTGGFWLLIPASLAMLFQNLLFSNHARSWLTSLASLIGVATMIVLFPGLTRSAGSAGALGSVGAGLWIWAALAALETLRSGFFKRRAADDSVPHLGVADVW